MSMAYCFSYFASLFMVQLEYLEANYFNILFRDEWLVELDGEGMSFIGGWQRV